VRFTALQGIVNVRPAEPLGSPRPLRPRRFRRDPRFLPNAVPRSLALTGSSPRELRSSSESSASHPQSPSPATAPSLGLRSLFATSPDGVRAAGFPTPAAFPSSAFRTPATVCSAFRLVGLFHPTATSRVRPSGNFPRAQPSRLVDVSCPLVVERRRAASVARSATRRRPAHRAFIRARVRGYDAGV
jgi:hypothetical protein